MMSIAKVILMEMAELLVSWRRRQNDMAGHKMIINLSLVEVMLEKEVPLLMSMLRMVVMLMKSMVTMLKLE